MTGVRLERTVERWQLDEPVTVPFAFGQLLIHAVDRHILPSGATTLVVDAQRVDGTHLESRCSVHVDDDTAHRLDALLPPVNRMPTGDELEQLTVEAVTA